ncbi:hypothetical protein BB559_001851, partial [Furculomyces boomerangus]
MINNNPQSNRNSPPPVSSSNQTTNDSLIFYDYEAEIKIKKQNAEANTKKRQKLWYFSKKLKDLENDILTINKVIERHSLKTSDNLKSDQNESPETSEFKSPFKILNYKDEFKRINIDRIPRIKEIQNVTIIDIERQLTSQRAVIPESSPKPGLFDSFMLPNSYLFNESALFNHNTNLFENIFPNSNNETEITIDKHGQISEISEYGCIYQQMEKELLIPEPSIFEEMLWTLTHSRQIMMLPIRIPFVLEKIRKKLLPNYFYYVLLGAGMRYVWKKRGEQELEMEKKYAMVTAYYLAKVKNFDNPYYVWSCLLLGSFYSIVGMRTAPVNYGIICIDAAIANNYHTIDKHTHIPSKKRHCGMEGGSNPELFEQGTGEKLDGSDLENEGVYKEFIRRIWWSCYIVSISSSMILGYPLRIKVNELAVNLPKSDFKFRYGGRADGLSPKVMMMNSLANSNNEGTLNVQDFSTYVCKLHLNLGKMLHFMNNRLTEKNRTFNTLLDTEELIEPNTLRSLSGEFKKSRMELETANIEMVLDNIKIDIETQKQVDFKVRKMFAGMSDDLLDGFVKMSMILYRFHTQVMYYEVRIYYNLSNLVCVKLGEKNEDNVCMQLSPEIVKKSKNECIKAALRMMNLISWGIKNIPVKSWDPHICLWLFYSGIVFTNAQFLRDHPKIAKIKEGMKTVVDIIKDFTIIYPTSAGYTAILDLIRDIKIKSHAVNKKRPELFDLMKPYCITDTDYNPWITPR